MLIEGNVLEGNDEPIEVVNPATEETIAAVGSASARQLDDAVASACTAYKAWKRTPAAERGEMLRALTCFDFYAELGRTERGRVVPSGEAGQLNLVLKEPYGVGGAIVPWNYPILLLAWKLAPALAAGNTVVVKPSPYTPMSTLELSRGIAEIFPPGVVNVVTGGAEVGAGLVAHPDVAMIAFTGSVETGKAVMCSAADQMKKVHLELGGKDAFIVCEDVDLEVAAKGAVWAAYLNTGQVCTSAERFYVAEQVYDDFLDAFVSETRNLIIGDPMRDDTDIGPMVRGIQRDLMRKETFGPVAPIARVASLDEAIERTNASEFGLGANVYTRRLDYTMKAMEEIEAGTVWFNDPLTDNEAAPFGGMKSSGNGRELGPEGLDDFRQTKHVHIDTNMDAKSWWYPYSEYVRHQAEHGTAPG